MSLSFLNERSLQLKEPSIVQIILLDQTFVHCPISLTAGRKIQPGPYFSSSVVDHSLESTKDHWLGKLLKLPTT
jgi:hypothetical protein